MVSAITASYICPPHTHTTTSIRAAGNHSG
jgi:hypothetical protein